MKRYKIVVLGPFNAGKTAFVRTASDMEILSTERKNTAAEAARIKAETTVALDYGQVRLAGRMLHLYGTPGQERFNFMRQIVGRDADAFLLLVDSGDRGSLMEAMQILREARRTWRGTPYLVVANKQDGRRPLSEAEIARLLKLPEEVAVVPCVAHDRESVVGVLRKAVEIIE